MAEYEGEGMLHPFTSYNKQPKEVPTLVGNWQEERALKDVTGTTRYEPWTDKGVTDRREEPQVSVYATRQEPNVEAQSFTRTIEHSQQTNPANWQSVSKGAFQDPKTKPTLMSYKEVPHGPREKRMMEELMREANQLPDAMHYSLTARPYDVPPSGQGVPAPYQHHGITPVLDSTYRAHFDEKDMSGLMIGTRVMKDHDERPAVRDPTFLAETQILQKGDCDRIIKQDAIASGATQTVVLADPNIPVTLYSESVAKGSYGGAVTGTRTMSKVSPFNKYTNFSKPMSEYNKVVIDE